MKRKFLSVLAAVSMVGVLLSGCGGSGQSTTTAAKAAATTAKAAAATTAKAAAATTKAAAATTAKAASSGSGQKVTLQFWHAFSGSKNDLVEQMCKDFTAAHPNIEVVPTYQGDYWTEASKAQSAIAGGDAPDLLIMGADHVSIFASADNMLADLKPYFQKSNMSTDDLVQAFSWDYFVDNKLVALPFGRSTPVLYVNTDMLKEVGKEIPTTWDELHDVCKALIKKEGNEQTRYGMAMGYDTWYWFMIVAQAGGQFINTERTGLGCVDDGTMATGFKFWQDLHNDGSMFFGPVTDSDTACSQLFFDGKCGMYLSSVGGLKNVEKNAEGKFNMKLAYVPKGKVQVVPTGGCSIGMMNSSKHKEEAWEFLHWILTDPKGGATFCLGTGYLPYTKSMAESDAFKKYYASDPNAKTAYDQLQFASDKGHRVPQVGNIMTDLQTAIQAIMYDNSDVNDQIKKLQSAVADIMKK